MMVHIRVTFEAYMNMHSVKIRTWVWLLVWKIEDQKLMKSLKGLPPDPTTPLLFFSLTYLTCQPFTPTRSPSASHGWYLTIRYFSWYGLLSSDFFANYSFQILTQKCGLAPFSFLNLWYGIGQSKKILLDVCMCLQRMMYMHQISDNDSLGVSINFPMTIHQWYGMVVGVFHFTNGVSLEFPSDWLQ